uniref:Putative trypsin-like serine protease n=1 Tax=Amblyomma triste TaxID=251400 RepID=A0A023GIF3_AMBTT
MITRRHVLTAGHCLLPEEFKPRYVVRYGSPRTSRQATAFVAKVYKHPNCHMVNQDRAVDDVAVLVLRSALPVPPVCLPRAGAPLPSEVTVAGWGNTIPSIDSLQLPELLKEAQMHVISNERCQEEHSYANLQHQICAQPASGFPGVGDSGGPLMTKGSSGEWTLVGVVSWGNETRFRTSPFVFSDVTALLSWIQDVVSMPIW